MDRSLCRCQSLLLLCLEGSQELVCWEVPQNVPPISLIVVQSLWCFVPVCLWPVVLVCCICLQGYPTAGQSLGLDARQSKLFTKFPQKLLSKRTESIWCLFGNKFVVDKFSELLSTEITMFSIIEWSDYRSRSQVDKTPTVKKSGAFLRIRLLQIQNNLNNRFAFPTKHRILPRLSVAIQWTILTARHLVYLRPWLAVG